MCWTRQLFIGMTLLTVSACGDPDITSLEPAQGPPRTLVRVDGDTIFSKIYWDAGLAAEQELTGGFLGGYLFTVPENAVVGAHNVQLSRNDNRSNIAPFQVTPNINGFERPRIDRVSAVNVNYSTTQAGERRASGLLYVQVANGDVGADIFVDGAPVAAFAHQAMVNDLLGVNPDDLGYPIYHYTAYVVMLSDQPVGTDLAFQAENTDGLESDLFDYRIPDSDVYDRDGDDLLDRWENGFYDADGDGASDLNLENLGADPLQPTVFVELDIMEGLDNPPTANDLMRMEGVFANAPILNPTGENGIRLVLDASGSVPFHDMLDFSFVSTDDGVTDFNDLKAAHFDEALKGRISHYGIWARRRSNNSTGISDTPAGTFTERQADEFIISVDSFFDGNNSFSRVEVFLHELGHNLGQEHGGANGDLYNPVYNSVLSYSWQSRALPLVNSIANRVARPVYVPFYYGVEGVVEQGGIPIGGGVALPPATTTADYSEGMGRTLNEANLNEPGGLYNGNSIDWNGDGDTIDINVTADANNDDDTEDVLRDYGNWRDLDYTGPRLNGAN